MHATEHADLLDDLTAVFGEPIAIFTRAQAIADGQQVDLSAHPLTKEAGIAYPIYMTRAAYSQTLAAGGEWRPTAPGSDTELLHLPAGQDLAGRLWDICTMLRYAIKANPRHPGGPLKFSVLVDRHGDGKPKPVTLYADCGPVDYDDPAPCITIMTREDL